MLTRHTATLPGGGDEQVWQLEAGDGTQDRAYARAGVGIADQSDRGHGFIL